jgi:hypothetical protein
MWKRSHSLVEMMERDRFGRDDFDLPSEPGVK